MANTGCYSRCKGFEVRSQLRQISLSLQSTLVCRGPSLVNLRCVHISSSLFLLSSSHKWITWFKYSDDQGWSMFVWMIHILLPQVRMEQSMVKARCGGTCGGGDLSISQDRILWSSRILEILSFLMWSFRTLLFGTFTLFTAGSCILFLFLLFDHLLI